PKARQAKSKARVAHYQDLVAEAERYEKLDSVEIPIPPGPRLGDIVVEVENLKKGYGDKLLIDGLSFRLPPGGIVGVIGPNGAGNLLLLDERTNDLDDDTLRALEDALLGFAGCVVVISHDRWFLDRIATHILAFEGDSKVVWFEGNFREYEIDKKRRLGADAD